MICWTLGTIKIWLVLLTMCVRMVITSHLLLTVLTLYFADSHKMATLNATKLLLLTNHLN